MALDPGISPGTYMRIAMHRGAPTRFRYGEPIRDLPASKPNWASRALGSFLSAFNPLNVEPAARSPIPFPGSRPSTYRSEELEKAQAAFTAAARGNPEAIGGLAAMFPWGPFRGKPFYHGTGAVFDRFRVDPKDSTWPTSGIFATEDPSIASSYAGMSFLEGARPRSFRSKEEIENYINTNMPEWSGSRNLSMLYRSQRLKGAAAKRAGTKEVFYFNSRPPRTPNVRIIDPDIRRPFDLDAPLEAGEAQEAADIVRRLYEAQVRREKGVFGVSSAAQKYPLKGIEEIAALERKPGATGMELAETLGAQAPLWGSFFNPRWNQDVPRWQDYTWAPGGVGPPRILERMGYDAATHLGGGRIGDQRHRVAIMFRPGQARPFYR